MKKIFFLFLFLFSTAAAAENVVLSFDKVPVVDLLNAVYGDILHESYAIDPALVDRPETVTVHFRDGNKEQITRYITGLLDSLGLEAVSMPGHILIRKKADSTGKDVYVFRPKYRTAGYVLDLIGNFFPSLSVGKSRNLEIGSGGAPASKASASLNLNGDNGSAGAGGGSSISMTDIDAFVFEGTPQEIERLKRFIAVTDTPVGEVLIKAIVYEVGGTKKDGSAVGLALNLLGGRLGVSFGKNGVGDSISIKSATIEAVYSALSSDSRFKVVSSPSVRVKSGSRGLISVGADVPVLGAVSYNAQGGATQSVSMKASGVILDLKPTVMESGVELSIKQQISNFVPTTTGVNSSPTLIKREISTTVGTSHDEIVILGGLDESKSTKDSSNLPFLPGWMGSQSTDDSKTEILLVLQVQKL